MSKAVVISPQKDDLLWFFVLTFSFSWGVWIGGLFVVSHLASFAIIALVGAFGPSASALILATTRDGRGGLWRLLSRVSRWRVDARWYVIVLGLPSLLTLLGTFGSVLLGAPVPDFGRPPAIDLYPGPSGVASVWMLLPLIFAQQVFLGSAMGEELGWRGYALPRLQATHTPLTASLILGAV